MNKFRYLIFPDRLYSFTINGVSVEMMGEDILAAIWKGMDDGK
jgi:hypothetical protein